MDILVIGGAGQVGTELAHLSWPSEVGVAFPGRADLDLADPASITTIVGSRSWAAVINAAAYTAVDRAENDVLAAWTVNALAPALLADATRRAGIPLIHISTDYVFDGRKGGSYDETDPVAPLGVYGASKEAGEQGVRTGNPRHAIVRTAWVVSPHRANFLKTMLRLSAERPVIRVVDDQQGSPTAAADLAAALAAVALRLATDPDAPTGTYHFVNSGATTWYGLACAIFEEAAKNGGPSCRLEAITTAEYPTPARRPANSVLATGKLNADYGIAARPWRDAIADVVAAVFSENTSRRGG